MKCTNPPENGVRKKRRDAMGVSREVMFLQRIRQGLTNKHGGLKQR